MLLALALSVLAFPVTESRAERLTALEKEYEAARNRYYDAYRAAKSPEERAKLASPDQAFMEKYRALAREIPPDDATVGAVTWIVSNASEPRERDEALAIVAKDLLKSPALGPLCDRLGSIDAIDTKLLESIAAENPDRGVRGHATYAIASHRLLSARRSRQIRAAQEENQGAKWLGEPRYEELAKLDAGRMEKEGEEFLEKVVKEYDDVELRGSTLGRRARGDLNEMRNLVVGKVAPEIAGEDLQGKPMKLSDFRGKVVLLDFWGNW